MKVKKKVDTKKDKNLKKTVKASRKARSVTEDSTVDKAVKNIKEELQKRAPKNESKSIVKKPVVKNLVQSEKKEKTKKKYKSTRGLVYVGHIPHGFYEEQLKEFFKQFGKVTKVRVARSKKTGNSKGYAYVQFDHPDVAKVAAETMNNYLMYGRLIKAEYVPPEQQHFGYFAGQNWSKKLYPTLKNRNSLMKKRNAPITTKDHKKKVEKTKKKLLDLQEKLKEHNIELNVMKAVVLDL